MKNSAVIYELWNLIFLKWQDLHGFFPLDIL